MWSIDRSRQLLNAAGVFFDEDKDDEDYDPKLGQALNLNDTFGWACADGEYVLDEELPRVAELFYRYGWCGILYWVSCKRGYYKCEFCDVNRFVEFVRQEEAICAEEPSDSERAYLKRSYTIEND